MVATAELTLYERIADPMAAAKFMGDAIAKSGMFGVAGEKQGIILALECMARRQPILTLTETYHVIHGRLSMKADKMLANFNEFGGKHRIISRTANLATVELNYQGDTQTFSFSWEEAQQEPFVYSGKESEVVAQLQGDRSKLRIKDKYATPRARMQMLWARVISDGVRAMCPQANVGKYTPEEIDDDLQPGSRSQVVASEIVSSEPIDENVIESHVVEEPAVEAASESVPFATSDDGYATAAQSVRINDLCDQLGLTVEQREKALKKRGASSNRGLKFEAAEELIRALENGVANKQLTAPQVEQAAQEVVGESRQAADSMSTHPAGPATKEQVEQAKAMLKELAQTAPGTFNRWKAHMDSKGLKIADLSAADAAVLIGDLHTKNMAAFFDLSLQKWQPTEAAAAEGDAKN